MAAEAADPKVLHLTREALMRHAAAAITEEQFPEALAMADRVAGVLQAAGLAYDPERPWSDHVVELAERLKARLPRTVGTPVTRPSCERHWAIPPTPSRWPGVSWTRPWP